MAKDKKTGGRKKGTPNKRQDLQEFLDAVFERADPLEVAEKLLRGKAPSERLFIRLLEYRFGRPSTLADEVNAVPKIIDVSGMRSLPKPPSGQLG
jgi:hypothetical protein